MGEERSPLSWDLSCEELISLMTMTFLIVLQGPRGKPGLPGMPGSDGLPVSAPHLYSPRWPVYSVCPLPSSLLVAPCGSGVLSSQDNLGGRGAGASGKSSRLAVTLPTSFLQGHPGKEGPPGTKGNQVRPSILPLTPRKSSALEGEG